MKTLFVPVYSEKGISDLLEKSVKYLKGISSVAIFSTIQHLKKIKEAEEFYKKNGFKTEILKSAKTDGQGIKAKKKGQILGCDASAALKAKSNVMIYIGSGSFHADAIFLNSKKKVLQLNPEMNSVSFFEDGDFKKFLAKKNARLQKLKDSRRVGIWVSTKPGQFNEKLALKVKKELESVGKDVFVFISDLLLKDEMINFRDIEVWVNTACPRIAEDSFPKPVVNGDEIKQQVL